MRENNSIEIKITTAIKIPSLNSKVNFKSVLQSSQNTNIIKAILFNNVEVTDESDIALLFNNFFTGVSTELESSIPATNTDPFSLISRVDASVFLYQVSVKECTNVLSKLKKRRQVSINCP